MINILQFRDQKLKLLKQIWAKKLYDNNYNSLDAWQTKEVLIQVTREMEI